jgi:hypothetical protein
MMILEALNGNGNHLIVVSVKADLGGNWQVLILLTERNWELSVMYWQIKKARAVERTNSWYNGKLLERSKRNQLIVWVWGIIPVYIFDNFLMIWYIASLRMFDVLWAVEMEGNTCSSYLYLYTHYYNYIKRSLFLLLPNEISLLPSIPSFSFLKVLIDFLTIRKYRKKDINNILWS